MLVLVILSAVGITSMAAQRESSVWILVICIASAIFLAYLAAFAHAGA